MFHLYTNLYKPRLEIIINYDVITVIVEKQMIHVFHGHRKIQNFSLNVEK